MAAAVMLSISSKMKSAQAHRIFILFTLKIQLWYLLKVYRNSYFLVVFLFLYLFFSFVLNHWYDIINITIGSCWRLNKYRNEKFELLIRRYLPLFHLYYLITDINQIEITICYHMRFNFYNKSLLRIYTIEVYYTRIINISTHNSLHLYFLIILFLFSS